MFPLVYEINTRCWLCELSGASRSRITLATVPDRELDRWQGLGFTHIWLMGVWSSGPRSRASALAVEAFRRDYGSLLQGFRETDIAGSPYAIADYRVARSFGGEAGLASFRRRLNQRGLKLMLDFVPNHLGLDHPWVRERPELFVQSAGPVPGTFAQETVRGLKHLAHGKDPNFAPWSDTVQLDYRRSETRAVMLDQLLSVAERCDGVRCDMAMLLLDEVFQRTWGSLPLPEDDGLGSRSREEFWPGAIKAVKQRDPKFLFLAEVYWGLEETLRLQGFDFSYDKELYDDLIRRNPAAVQHRLLRTSPGLLAAGAHFLENHDEPRIASLASRAEHRAWALLILALPGLRLLHEGQLTGMRTRVPVQFARRCVGEYDPEIQAMYEQLLQAVRTGPVGRGRFALLPPREAWAGNPTFQNFVVTEWQSEESEFVVAAVNLAPHAGQCSVELAVAELEGREWRICDRLGSRNDVQSGAELKQNGLRLDLPGHGGQLLWLSVRD